jgi:hypothetical protein
MARTAPLRLVTPRDLEILLALDHSPLTALQLLRWSETFEAPFRTERRVRERMQALSVSGRVCRRQYAVAGRGAPNYYTLSRLGYQLLHGEGAEPPTKRAFGPVGLSRQHHTQSLAEFLTHTVVAAHRAGITFSGFSRENTFRLQVGEECLYPDCGFQLLLPDGPALGFFVELDNSTERIRSATDLDSWQRKIRLYDAFQDRSPRRFRVLILSTRSAERASRILAAAAELASNPARSLFYGVALPRYLAEADPLRLPCFLDHRGRPAALVPPGRRVPAVPLGSPLAIA